MADDDLRVTISGAALSLLFFENVRSVGDQMGFLLGEVVEFFVKTYTDSDNQVETVKVHINVETIMTCPLYDLVHDSAFRVNREKLKNFVRDKSKQVIGWFHFRQNTSSLIPTLKDKIFHKQLASHFSSENGCREDLFLTCLLNASVSETGGTHKFRHVFLRHKQRALEPVPLRINNLGDDASRHDGSDYKPTPYRKSARVQDGFTELIESLSLDVTRTGGVDCAMAIQKAAQEHLTSLIPKVCESDMQVAELERQVCELRAKILEQQLAKRPRVNGETCERIAKVQPNNRNPSRNTAACIAKSIKEKSGRISRGSPLEAGNTQHDGSPNVRPAVPQITTEPICQEGSGVGVGRGRGSGRGNHEFTPGMKKVRRVPGAMQTHSPRDSATPELQDFSDADCSAASPLSPSVLRSHNQAPISFSGKQ